MKFESCAAKKYKRQHSKCFNKYYNQPVSKPFFLTRQTANLMEDFVRELKAGSALFLLYGDHGVGKTRLLQELNRSRLGEMRIHWIDLRSGDGSDDERLDRSADIEKLFETAGSGDVIIADHFETALKKTRHQLFLSWSTDGIDKGLNLIIASSTEGFDELRQLSQQYQVRVQSFQQMPFSADEVEAFLGFYLFPDHPIGKLSIAAPLRKQLAASQGVVARLIEVADREGAMIESTPLTETESIRQGSRIIASVLVLFVLAIGVGWYLIREPDTIESQATAITESEPAITNDAILVETVAVEPPPAVQSPSANSPETTVTAETVAVIDVSDPPSAPDAPGEVGAAPATVDELAVESAPAAVVEAEAQVTEAAPAATLSASETGVSEQVNDPQAETTLASAESLLVEPAAVAADNRQRFLRELQTSLDWIYQRTESVGTIQILLLSFENFDADVYYEYVSQLASQQVDTAQLRVFKTYTGDAEVYSVVYGEYQSRSRALKAIGALPEVLKDTSPIPRSVGGIWEEIRRLEAKN